MDCLVGYGSDDDNESERFDSRPITGASGPASRRRDDDTNYDDVNMDLSDDSEGSQSESEPELPPADGAPSTHSSHSSRDGRRGSDDSRDHVRKRDYRDRDPDRRDNRDADRRDNRDADRRDKDVDRRDKGVDRRDRDEDRRDRDPGRRDYDRRRESPVKSRLDRDRSDKRSPRRDDRHSRSDERSDRSRSRGHDGSSRRPMSSEKSDKGDSKVPALMDLKPFNGDPPPTLGRSQDSRDAVSPRFADRDRRDRDRERERDRDRHGRRSEERRFNQRRERSRSRGAAFPPPSHSSSSNERRSPPSGEYRPSFYKVNKKLEVMEKMGLQIKTPDGSMATAQQLRAAAGDPQPRTAGGLPSYYNPAAVNTNKILDQVQKRKLLWSNKSKAEAEAKEAAKWTGARFSQDNDGKQVSKFMRLMGIKEPAAVKPEEAEAEVDPIKKQEEMFQAMQAQYDVARATTHTMRGVGLGFQRGQF